MVRMYIASLNGGSLRIARVAGIPIRLHWSFLGLVGLYLAFSLVSGGAASLVGTIGLVGALFGSVILHELGHALTARTFGVETAHITLFPFGGVAAMTSMPTKPWQEFLIALAGPMVNLVILAVALPLHLVTGVDALLWLAVLNGLMGLFNLIPAFPMDGGRILRALLATRLGYVPASRLAMRVGRLFAWGFLGVGIVAWLPSLILVAGFLHLALTAERRRLDWFVRQAAYEEWRRTARYVPQWTLAPRGSV